MLEIGVVTDAAAPAGLASHVLLAKDMACAGCSKTAPGDTRTGGDLCPEHALAALEQVGRRLADSRALLESAIQRARVFA